MMISQTATAKGKIEYSLLGQGKIILFVHGGHVNCRETIFQKGLDPEKFCFLTPSRPGYGRTPLTDQNRTPKGTADLYVSLLDKLEIPKASIIGISAGGLTAIEIAAHYPARVENLVLISALTKKWFTENDKVYKGGKKIFSPKIEWLTWSLYRVFFRLFPRFMAKAMFKELSTYRPIRFTKDEFKELKEMTLNMRSGEGFANDLDQVISQDILSEIECPTLILHSNYDNAVDISHAENAKTRIKNSTMVTFNNHWGHLLWIGSGYQAPLNELEKRLNG
jgi:pimeloyl-ACP methyl ester carboxylesterase